MMNEIDFVQPDGRVNVQDIDKDIMNKFIWSWMYEKEDAPHLLDVSGDTCHTIHNSVKAFCDVFDKEKVFRKTLDDIYADFHFSADLTEELQNLTECPGAANLMPLQRCGHRWLSIYDTSEILKELWDPLNLFYFAFMKKEDQTLYEPEVASILKSVSTENKEKIKDVMRRLRSKGQRLTDAGKKRKERVIQKLLYKRRDFLLRLNIIISVLPMFKSFVLTFEQKCPMMHRLQMIEALKFFLASFLKIEKLTEGTLQEIDVNLKDNLRPLKSTFVGKPAEDILKSFGKDEKKAFLGGAVACLSEVRYNKNCPSQIQC